MCTMGAVLGGEGLAEPSLAPTLTGYWPQVWRIEDLELVPVESKWLGHFYGGDCYLLLYTYLIGEKQHYLLYIWQVRLVLPNMSPASSAALCHAPAVMLGLNTSGDRELTPSSGSLFHHGVALAVRS